MYFEHLKKSIISSIRWAASLVGRKGFGPGVFGLFVFSLLSMPPVPTSAEPSGLLENSSVAGLGALRVMEPEGMIRQEFRPGRMADCFEIHTPERGVLGFEVVTRPESASRAVIGLLEVRSSGRRVEVVAHPSPSFLGLEIVGGETSILCVAFLRPLAPREQYQVVSAFASAAGGQGVPHGLEEEENPEEDEPIPDPWSQVRPVRFDAP